MLSASVSECIVALLVNYILVDDCQVYVFSGYQQQFEVLAFFSLIFFITSTTLPHPRSLTHSHFTLTPHLIHRAAGICQAGSRLFIFDYGGTLLHKEKYDIYIKRQTLSAISGRAPSGE